ncbi:MAG: repair protein RecN [Acidobacteriota bacterium]|jgi:DNA repair protein RecN (Recombination protein N)|nr:repair protein RecN [Acidobacteriota bacterium]
MLALLNISNFALISELKVEFDRGLNLLTGETGSGKSIIVDALGVLIGDRFSPELIRAGERHAFVEGLFTLGAHPQVEALLEEAGVGARAGGDVELVVRRELSAEGRGRVFVNNRLATLSLLKSLRPMLVDIHGQGTQQTLFDPDTHLELLDAFADLIGAREEVAARFRRWSALGRELESLRRDEAEKFHLTDALRFQVSELEAARLVAGEDEQLETERRRLVNLEKLTELCADAYNLTYEESDSTVARLSRLERQVEELSQYESSYQSYGEALASARAVLEDLSVSLRGYLDALTFSPERLSEIESRLAELARLKRKYGGTVESALEHLETSRERLRQLEHTDERAEAVAKELASARASYLEAATRVHRARVKSSVEFRRSVEEALGEVALEHARFEARVAAPQDAELDTTEASKSFTSKGFDRVEFYFSANAGEPLRPLAKVASGGEASRLMLVLKTSSSPARFPRTIVFDEVDAGIGGRVSEAVGLKLKALAKTNQVLCVTHQAQIARFADTHLLVDKRSARGRTEVGVGRLDRRRQVEEIARMLTGAEITEAARRHAREMLKTA